MSKKNKDKIGVVYSTDPNFNYQFNEDNEQETISPEKQLLYVSIDRKQRAGKSVTLIEGFIGKEEDLELLGKQLKNKCGCGGSVKEGVILIQGELKDKIYDLLVQMKYKVKKKG
jgi:translation initiation factor 1